MKRIQNQPQRLGQEKAKNQKNIQNRARDLGRNLTPFIFTSVFWLLFSQALQAIFLLDSPNFRSSAGWMLFVWVLCNLDLFVLAQLVFSILKCINSPSNVQATHAIRALFWGIIKIVCLGLFVIVLLKGQKIPTNGLLLGMATLIVVPVLGGLFWYQRTLRNARRA